MRSVSRNFPGRSRMPWSNAIFAALLLSSTDQSRTLRLYERMLAYPENPVLQLIMSMPNWSSMKAITDPLAQWPPLCSSSFMVYSVKWREQEKVDCGLVCDFRRCLRCRHGYDGDMTGRNDEYVQKATKNWINVAHDLHRHSNQGGMIQARAQSRGSDRRRPIPATAPPSPGGTADSAPFCCQYRTIDE